MKTVDVKHDLDLMKSSLGLTNAEIAERLHVSAQTISSWLNGREASTKNAKKVVRLAAIAKVEPSIRIPLALRTVARRHDVSYLRLEQALFAELIPLDGRDEDAWEQLLQAVVTYPGIFALLED